MTAEQTTGPRGYRGRHRTAGDPDTDRHATNCTFGPLDRADWPRPGDEVLYRMPTPNGGRWIAATVLHVADHDGDLCLALPSGIDALDAKHGDHEHGWLLYREAAETTRLQVLADKARRNPAPISTEEGTNRRG